MMRNKKKERQAAAASIKTGIAATPTPTASKKSTALTSAAAVKNTTKGKSSALNDDDDDANNNNNKDSEEEENIRSMRARGKRINGKRSKAHYEEEKKASDIDADEVFRSIMMDADVVGMHNNKKQRQQQEKKQQKKMESFLDSVNADDVFNYITDNEDQDRIDLTTSNKKKGSSKDPSKKATSKRQKEQLKDPPDSPDLSKPTMIGLHLAPRIFDRWDEDANGSLERSELEKYVLEYVEHSGEVVSIDPLTVAMVMDEVDSDNNSALDRTEFVQFLKVLAKECKIPTDQMIYFMIELIELERTKLKPQDDGEKTYLGTLLSMFSSMYGNTKDSTTTTTDNNDDNDAKKGSKGEEEDLLLVGFGERKKLIEKEEGGS